VFLLKKSPHDNKGKYLKFQRTFMDYILVPATKFRIFAIIKKNMSEVAGQKNTLRLKKSIPDQKN
jgi:hypothetical protein